MDELGGVHAAFDTAKRLAGLPEDARVVVYRRREFGNDTPYNPLASTAPNPMPLVDLGPMDDVLNRPAGFYHLWLP